MLADVKLQYYKEKLEMKRQQHQLFLKEHTMRVQLLELQMKKLEE